MQFYPQQQAPASAGYYQQQPQQQQGPPLARAAGGVGGAPRQPSGMPSARPGAGPPAAAAQGGGGKLGTAASLLGRVLGGVLDHEVKKHSHHHNSNPAGLLGAFSGMNLGINTDNTGGGGGIFDGGFFGGDTYGETDTYGW
jgi:hypothetical protein